MTKTSINCHFCGAYMFERDEPDGISYLDLNVCDKCYNDEKNNS